MRKIFAVLVLLGKKMNEWKTAAITAVAVLAVGFAAYYFYFQQLFVKRWGGVMSISVPEGQLHITATWKDDNLWIENYDPKTNTCYFNEYSRGNLLQGKVVIVNRALVTREVVVNGFAHQLDPGGRAEVEVDYGIVELYLRWFEFPKNYGTTFWKWNGKECVMFFQITA